MPEVWRGCGRSGKGWGIIQQSESKTAEGIDVAARRTEGCQFLPYSSEERTVMGCGGPLAPVEELAAKGLCRPGGGRGGLAVDKQDVFETYILPCGAFVAAFAYQPLGRGAAVHWQGNSLVANGRQEHKQPHGNARARKDAGAETADEVFDVSHIYGV